MLTSNSFLKVQSVAAAGGTVINYSDRFTLSGMTGAFPPDVVAANAAVKGTAGPPTVNQVAGANAPAAGTGEFAVPYTLQTGPTKFAPMQPVPPTKITKVKQRYNPSLRIHLLTNSAKHVAALSNFKLRCCSHISSNSKRHDNLYPATNLCVLQSYQQC